MIITTCEWGRKHQSDVCVACVADGIVGLIIDKGVVKPRGGWERDFASALASWGFAVKTLTRADKQFP